MIVDWWCYSVNWLIEMVDFMFEKYVFYVEFGVSLFGVWCNWVEDFRGFVIQASIGVYDVFYVDVLCWVEEGWIDYLVLQFYWYIGFEIVDYVELQCWWSWYKGKAKFYVGYVVYKVGCDNMEQWLLLDELFWQI